MKILLTGGGSGGHFYPVIAVAEALREVAKKHKIANLELFYMAPQPYDEHALYAAQVTFLKSSSGKRRRYFSLLNYLDIFRTAWGLFRAIGTIYSVYPDVVFSKGGYVSFPALFAARLFRIPVIIHESDSVPGRVNAWSAKFARKIAISYPQAERFFKKEKVFLTGNPIRRDLLHASPEGGRDFFALEEFVPTVLILGGSQGAQFINENVDDVLAEMVEKFQVIHQTGQANFVVAQETAKVVLQNSQHKARYKPYANLDTLALRMAAGASTVIVSRAGSTIFEIAVWGVPAILIPITDSNGDHQRQNAYNYARTGAAVVIEENNLTPHLLLSEMNRVATDVTAREKMKSASASFAHTDAAQKIAEELISIGIEHE